MNNIMNTFMKFMNEHQNSVHDIISYLFGGISVSSIFKWELNNRAKQIKRSKARIHELDDIVNHMHYADKQIRNPKYTKRVENEYVFKTNVYSRYHIKYFKNSLNRKSKDILDDIIKTKAYKASIKELIRWCNRVQFHKMNKKYFCLQAGKEYINLIDKHIDIINKFRKTNDTSICYTLYDKIKSITKEIDTND